MQLITPFQIVIRWHRRANSRAAAGVGCGVYLWGTTCMKPQKTGVCTSGASWVKRTTQGHFKCRGRSRMERRLRAFVKLHKERLQKSPLFDRGTCRRAELPIVMRLYCILVLYHTNSVLSRGFCKIFWIIFSFDENRQKGRPSDRRDPGSRNSSCCFQKIHEMVFTNSQKYDILL